MAVKNIYAYHAEKYSVSIYSDMGNGIYKGPKGYVLSLSFQQEPELGEGRDASDISQYPLEDILEKYYVHITDFYPEKNTKGSSTCFLEFCSINIDHLIDLSGIIGKHVFNKTMTEGGQQYVRLIIE